MFRFLTIAIVALSANAVLLQEGDDQECSLELNEETGLMELKCVSKADIEAMDGCVLKMDDQVDLPDGVKCCGETIIDEMVEDFNHRQECRVAAHLAREANKAERERILGLHQPCYETK